MTCMVISNSLVLIIKESGTMLACGTLFIAFSLVASSTSLQDGVNATAKSRKGRALSLFEVVRFKNDVCMPAGATRMGTCYTSDECTRRKGSPSGTCANGFGVCCIISLACGQTSSDNNTYITGTGSTSPTMVTVCSYGICKASPDICRIRLDFLKHTLTGPTVGTTDSQEEDNGLAVGDCITDSFTVKNPRAKSPPVVCGFNDGQHMIYEMSSPCSSLDFVLGGGAMARQWDIKVTQYKCHNDDIAGPSGCLQYFTQPTGRISNFNFPTTSTVVGSTVTHLSRQAYTVCIRRMAGMCSICYSPSLNPVLGSATDQTSFGLSKGTMALQDTACVDDFVQIPFGELDAATPMGQGIQMFCGRGFNVVPATISATVCSSYLPFQLNYAVSQNEVDKGANNEQKGFPGGIVGFSLDYFQVPC
ncbi:uncharacterized protein LOC131880365 isoform X2 [Tigriopus californicus]|uniref:uncharacterized protein LOC131880365 isoform X2 n=1 Tax=Tigriopus californicus TaxID=6832 RepID=UPI0027DA733E|nr:uncharacterized protein LOC131880365 isoform X2 [Tigriopus californicus]